MKNDDRGRPRRENGSSCHAACVPSGTRRKGRKRNLSFDALIVPPDFGKNMSEIERFSENL
ncbi:MAG: hypothetical protein Q4C53_02455 [Clostridia bacterium]|nr:hypothetical protein [Clostridia bacterium]